MAKNYVFYKAGDATTSWTVPAGCTNFNILIGGGGGSGWSGPSGTPTVMTRYWPGGGGGQVTFWPNLTLAPGGVVTFSIGAGGEAVWMIGYDGGTTSVTVGSTTKYAVGGKAPLLPQNTEYFAKAGICGDNFHWGGYSFATSGVTNNGAGDKIHSGGGGAGADGDDGVGGTETVWDSSLFFANDKFRGNDARGGYGVSYSLFDGGVIICAGGGGNSGRSYNTARFHAIGAYPDNTTTVGPVTRGYSPYTYSVYYASGGGNGGYCVQGSATENYKGKNGDPGFIYIEWSDDGSLYYGIAPSGPISFGDRLPGQSIANQIGYFGPNDRLSGGGTYASLNYGGGIDMSLAWRLKTEDRTNVELLSIISNKSGASIDTLRGHKARRYPFVVSCDTRSSSYPINYKSFAYYESGYTIAFSYYFVYFYKYTETTEVVASRTYNCKWWGYNSVRSTYAFNTTNVTHAAWGVFMNNYAVWWIQPTNTNPSIEPFHREWWIYFPTAGTYKFQYAFDNVGEIFVDEKWQAAVSGYYLSNDGAPGTSGAAPYFSYTIGNPGSYRVTMRALNTGTVGSGNPGGAALRIYKPDGNLLATTRTLNGVGYEMWNNRNISPTSLPGSASDPNGYTAAAPWDGGSYRGIYAYSNSGFPLERHATFGSINDVTGEGQGTFYGGKIVSLFSYTLSYPFTSNVNDLTSIYNTTDAISIMRVALRTPTPYYFQTYSTHEADVKNDPISLISVSTNPKFEGYTRLDQETLAGAHATNQNASGWNRVSINWNTGIVTYTKPSADFFSKVLTNAYNYDTMYGGYYGYSETSSPIQTDNSNFRFFVNVYV